MHCWCSCRIISGTWIVFTSFEQRCSEKNYQKWLSRQVSWIKAKYSKEIPSLLIIEIVKKSLNLCSNLLKMTKIRYKQTSNWCGNLTDLKTLVQDSSVLNKPLWQITLRTRLIGKLNMEPTKVLSSTLSLAFGSI